MEVELGLLILLTLVASSVGTLTGFGTSTIMVPILLLFVPLPQTLLFAGVIHWFGDIWKMMLFRSGIRWALLLLFGGVGIVASYIGASLILTMPAQTLSRLLGAVLLGYVVWLWRSPRWKLPARPSTALAGGVLSGFLVGLTGVGGAVRGAFLAAFNLPKAVYLFTAGAIALVVDSTRLITYVSQGTRLSTLLLTALVLCVPTSFLGAYAAKHIVDRIPQRVFRTVVAIFLALVSLKLIVWPV